MPAAVAIPLLTAGAAAGGKIVGAAISSSASKDAAQQQTQAANYGADKQYQATEDSLAFQKQQAAVDQANWEATQHANYNQYLNRYNAAKGLGSSIGFTLPDAPAYVPSTATLPSTPTTPMSGTLPAGSAPQTPAASFGNLSDPSAWMGLVGSPSQLATWVQQQNPRLSPGMVQYYVGKIQGQPGANPTEQAGSATYWSQKIQSDPTTGGSSAASSASGLPAARTLAAYTPGLSVPTGPTVAPFQLRSIGAIRPVGLPS